MTFEQDYIKVPEGIMRIARENGFYRSLIFWYKLKPIYQLGRFSKVDFINIVKSHYNISESNIRLHLNRLINAGLVLNYKHHYQIVSYDVLFKHFGYDLTIKIKNRKLLRKGNFAIDKISVDEHMDNIEDRIDTGEIKLNLRRQEHIVNKVPSKAMPNMLKPSFIEKGNKYSYVYDGTNIELSREKLLEASKSLIVSYKNKKINTLTGMSVRGICNLLGYKSTKSAHDFKHRCHKSGLMFIVEQKILFKKSCNFVDEVLLKFFLRKSDICFRGSMIENELYYRLYDSFSFAF